MTTQTQLTLVPATSLRRSARASTPELERLLHDTVLQTLELIARGGPDGDSTADELALLAADAALELRDIIDPSVAAQAGALAAELAKVVRRARRLSRSEIALVVGSTDGTLPEHTVRAMCGSVAEALNNARKHSGATRVVVYVEEACGAAECTVRDNGSGMDAACVDGFGIGRSLRARMREVGGEVSFDSSPDHGTKVTLMAHRKAA